MVLGSTAYTIMGSTKEVVPVGDIKSFPGTRETTVPRACDVEETGCPTPDSQQRWIPNGCMQLKMIARVLRGHIFTHNNIIP